jgi:hypothetical protein
MRWQSFAHNRSEVATGHNYERVILPLITECQEQLLLAFRRHVQPSYPLLDTDLLSGSMSSFLSIALSCVACPFCPSAQHTIRPQMYEDFVLQALSVKSRSATLETVEAALLFAQRHAYSNASVTAQFEIVIFH